MANEEKKEAGNSIKDTAEAIKGVLQEVPVYKDAIQPVAKNLGTELAPAGSEIGTTAARTIHMALAPLRALVWSYEQIEEIIVPPLQEKLKNRLNKLVAPSLMIAGPTLEALRFAGSNEALRNLYINLLATSMDEDTRNFAHPSFVDFVRQMLPDEARVLRVFTFQRFIPLVTLRVYPHLAQIHHVDESRGTNVVLSNYSLIGTEAACDLPDRTPTYLNNLIRMGLLEIPSQEKVTESALTPWDSYNKIYASGEFKQIVSQVEARWKQKPILIEKGVKLTPLGTEFKRAVDYTGA